MIIYREYKFGQFLGFIPVHESIFSVHLQDHVKLVDHLVDVFMV
jgi:hypothetical protein